MKTKILATAALMTLAAIGFANAADTGACSQLLQGASAATGLQLDRLLHRRRRRLWLVEPG
ncbi:MAG: hypothetical protein WA858_20185 [Xanthobacteraceae bacterium]